MEKSKILKKVKGYQKEGYDPTIDSGTRGWGATGGFECGVCEEHKEEWANCLYNKKRDRIIVCNSCFGLFFPPYKVKKILITSGGTREAIDEIRYITNISTGKLGALIQRQFDDCNNHLSRMRLNPVPLYEIFFVYVKGSEKPITWDGRYCHFYEVTDVKSVYKVMDKLVPDMDVVIHPMAVSDFGFKPINTKLKSNDPEAFIQSLKERIYQTPKILSHIKKWNPNCFLISFKFENGLEHDELIKIASDSMIKNGSDIVVANDKAEMKKLGEHKAYFLIKDTVKEVNGKEEIAKEIFNIVQEKYK